MQNYKAQIDTLSFDVTPTDLEELNVVHRADHYTLLKDNKNYKVELIDQDKKVIKLKVNNTVYEVIISDEVDQLVEAMGMDKPAEVIMTDVKAPMPGLILDIMVSAGTIIKAGDPLLILEAMKMENVIKAVGDGVVKSILLEKGHTVEKNQVILEME